MEGNWSVVPEFKSIKISVVINTPVQLVHFIGQDIYYVT